MKKILFFLLIFSTCTINSNAQNQQNGTKPTQEQTKENKGDKGTVTQNKTEPASNANNDTIDNDKKGKAHNESEDKGPHCCDGKPETIGLIISILPPLLFVIIMLLVFASLKSGGYKISDALKENDPVALGTKKTTQENGAQPIVNQETKDILPNSSSRLIAFLTGITTLTLASCVTSYWMYKSFYCCNPVDLKNLTAVFVTLGIGVIPYGTNRISAAFKNPPNNN